MNKIPLVAILGRPNVGKSTLFNRLIKKRKAIIDPTPGVTRDIIFGELIYNDNKTIKFLDTGGLTDEGDELNILVQKKSREALKDADLVIFLVESNKSLPIEIEYIEILRKLNKKSIIVVNKCDIPEKDININEYYQYGLGEPLAISASHNRNIDVLLERIIENLPEEQEIEIKEEEEKDVIRIAIVGKPNVGKSSLLNKIIGQERSIVSSIPGTTRDVVDGKFNYDNKEFIILDTAGIRRKSRVNEDIEYYSVNRAIKSISDANIIFLVIDSVENISDQDKKITDQIIKNGKALILVLNKWDLVDKNQDVLNEKKEMLLYKFPIVEFAPIIPISAKTGKGVENLLKTSIKIFNQYKRRIGTSELNDFIAEVVKKYTPASKQGVLKIYYGTQIKAMPVEFVFFINKKKLLTENYKQYIINRFREKFNYTGIPIQIHFRDKDKKEE
ncbi:MAG: ribosome biogenesis GTPase Der [Spirochaetes bacterium GWD1_27_9]|nr:MAG: ribosome biogenesis GTPase Der [Spirochaetes bacterium GWB1_27_13]OHD25514.1 MAG: ribosome biogenesis GTPase Der [Spirochaetes bacterium GWC1_27_15]OHD36705.1 MAG: ribosome biogenesis GTPase Der [Spirochaetes bacterium GWD1_27_9]